LPLIQLAELRGEASRDSSVSSSRNGITSHRDIETVADLRDARRSSGSRGLLGDGGVRTLERRLENALPASIRGKRIDGTLGGSKKSESSCVLSNVSCAWEGEGGSSVVLGRVSLRCCSTGFAALPVMLSDAASDTISCCSPKS
jgi:hypothetical protein